MRRIHAGIIGCGVISEIYLKNLRDRFHSIQVDCCADTDPARAGLRAGQFGIQAVSPDALLKDPELEMVINLTNPAAHTGVIMDALRAGKHVFTEKPLALTNADADMILRESTARGLLVGCAPDTLLGAGLQTSLFALRSGWIGRPLSATAFWSSRGHERWHTSPLFYYQHGGGPHLDMGPYYISALILLLGPVRAVHAVSRRAFSERVYGAGGHAGESFPVDVDTHYSALLEMAGGAAVDLMLSFDVWATRLPHMEIYGTGGTLSVPDPNTFDGPVELYTPASDRFETLPLVNPFRENARGIGASEMARCIAEGRSDHTAGIRMARHALEVMLAIDESARTGRTVVCTTECPQPAPLAAGLTEAEWQL